MKITAKAARILGSLITVLILTLVYTGRNLQYLIEQHISLVLAINSIPPLATIFSIIIYKYYYYLSHFYPRRLRLLHSLCTASIFSFLIWHIGDIYVEYAHILLYGLLYCSLRCVQYPRLQPFWIAILLTLGICCLDEYLQHIHPRRVGDIRDVILNGSSIILAGLIFEPWLAAGLKDTTESPLST